MADTTVPSTSPYAEAIGFSAAVRRGPVTVVAGQTAVDASGRVVGGDDARLQALEALRKAVALLEAAGASREDVVQSRLLLARREDWRAVGAAHAEVLGDVRPAATMVVAGMLDERMLVEVELLAVTG